MVVQSSNAANAAVGFSLKLNRLIAGGSLDYNSWRSLILEIEASCSESVDTISLAYDSFLSRFPLCHWNLEKYAHHKAKLSGPQEAVKIYERRSEVAMFSVGFWVHYFTFCASCSKDPDDVRRLFAKAISFVDKDYYCHALWDKYMKYEFNQEGWGFLASSYIQALRFPTKKLQFYYDNFKQFVANLEEEIKGDKSDNMEVSQMSGPCAVTEMSKYEITIIIKDLLDSPDGSIKSKALNKYKAIGENFYKEACRVEEKISCFEKKILRRYFYPTPLDDDQLNTWHLYLDFIEKLDDLDWAVKLYERCLIPCANYPEFWMRYVEFLESKGGRELAISALDRAAQIFLKNVPEIHLFSARYKEHIRDVDGARAALLRFDAKTDSSFIEKTFALANLERRLGNFTAASATFEKALETAMEKRWLLVLPTLYARFAELTLVISGSAAARDVLIEGVRRVPDCTRLLLEELIKFAMTHEGESHLNVIDAIIACAISPESEEYQHLNAKDRENISCFFLEYVNLCGTIHDVRKAWNRHVRLFPRSLRMRTMYNKSTSSNFWTDGARADNDETNATGMLEMPSPRKDQETSADKAVASSELDQFPNNELESSRQCREDNLGRIVYSAELMDRSRRNALSFNDKQSEENALIPHESGQETGKLSETIESFQADFGKEFGREKHLVSLDNSLNPEEKEPQESISMSIDKNESQRGIQDEQSTPTKGYDKLSITADNIKEIDKPATASGGKLHIKLENARQNPEIKKSSPEQFGTIQEEKAETVKDQAASTMMSSTNVSSGQTPASSQPVSYPMAYTNQATSQNSQNPWETQQGMAMNQMLQYHYQQQQLLQQQYQQQQLQMQEAYYQLQQNYQQFYQQTQPQHQQQHPQQSQSSSYQAYQMQQQIPTFQQPQTEFHQQYYLQGQETTPKFQQTHVTQQQQTQDLASYQVHQLSYQQQASQAQQQQQQLLLQQYQQYQAYQHMQPKQQSQEGPPNHLQEQHISANSTQQMSQNQQGSRSAPPDSDAAAKPSESPHLRARSPQVL